MQLLASLIDSANALILDASTQATYEQVTLLRSFSSAKKTLESTFGSKTFVIGAAFNKVLVPNESVEMTQLLCYKNPKLWSLQAIDALNYNQVHNSFKSSDCEVVEFSPIQSIQMSVDYNYLECQLQCLIGLRLSLNGIHGILLTAAVERFDLAIGQNGLFKRSLILIKVWVNCESNRFSFLVLSKLLRHDSLVVITMMIFIQHFNDIHDPVSALLRFLEILSGMDWTNSLITAMGIRLKSEDNLSSSVDDDKSSEDGNGNATLVNILLQYRRILAETTISEQSSSDPRNLSNDTADEESVLPIEKGPSPKPNVEEDIVAVMDPFCSGRNLCSRSPYFFRSKNIAEQLRTLFSKGLQELLPLLSAPSEGETKNGDTWGPLESAFPWTCALLCSRKDTIYEPISLDVDRVAAAFHSLCLNTSFADNTRINNSLCEGTTSVASINLSKMITFATQILSRKLSAESIVNLIAQILLQHGPLPVGEIGKEIHAAVQMPEFARVFKKRFGGLKAFISAQSDFLVNDSTHNFNPSVDIIIRNDDEDLFDCLTNNHNRNHKSLISTATAAEEDLSEGDADPTPPAPADPPRPRRIRVPRIRTEDIGKNHHSTPVSPSMAGTPKAEAVAPEKTVESVPREPPPSNKAAAREQPSPVLYPPEHGPPSSPHNSAFGHPQQPYPLYLQQPQPTPPIIYYSNYPQQTFAPHLHPHPQQYFYPQPQPVYQPVHQPVYQPPSPVYQPVYQPQQQQHYYYHNQDQRGHPPSQHKRGNNNNN